MWLWQFVDYFARPKDHLTFWIITFYQKWHSVRSDEHRLRETGNDVFHLPRNFTWLRDQRIIRICGWLPFILNHHFVQFDGHSPSWGEDITFKFIPWLLVTMWLKSHVSWWLAALYSKPTHCNICFYRLNGKEDITFFICIWH